MLTAESMETSWRTAYLSPLLLIFACVGEDVIASAGIPDASDVDASANVSVDTPDGDQTQQAPSIALSVAPVSLVQGRHADIKVRVVQRTGAAVPTTLQLRGGPAGLTFGAPAILLPSEDETTLNVAVGIDTAYGETSLQISATAPEFAQESVTTFTTSVRGAPGTLDRSFGNNGVIFSAGSVAFSGNGTFLQGLSKYDKDGQIDPGFGAFTIPPIGDCSDFTPYQTLETSEGWTLVGGCGLDNTEQLMMKVLVRNTPPYEAVFSPPTPGAPVPRPISIPPSAIVGSGELFAIGYNSIPDYDLQANLMLVRDSGLPAPGWTTAGIELGPTDSSQSVDIRDLHIGGDFVYVLKNISGPSGPFVQIVRSSGVSERQIYTSNAGHHFSRISTDEIYLARLSDRACITRFSGTSFDSYPPSCAESLPSSPPYVDAHVAKLNDGRFVVVGFDSQRGKAWTLSAAGQAESPLDGIELSSFSPMGQDAHVLVGADSQNRIIVSVSGYSAETRRFWL